MALESETVETLEAAGLTIGPAEGRNEITRLR